MNIKYMFDKLDIIKYRFLKEFMEASKSKELTIFPMKSECKDANRLEFLKKILGDDIWKKYYEGVCSYLDVKEDVRYELKNKGNLQKIIFLDPDTGIKKEKTAEHLSLEEIDEFGKSNTIIIYQHRNRGVEFEKDIDDKREKLNKRDFNIYVENDSKEIFFIIINPKNVDFPKLEGFSKK